MRRLGRSGHR